MAPNQPPHPLSIAQYFTSSTSKVTNTAIDPVCENLFNKYIFGDLVVLCVISTDLYFEFISNLLPTCSLPVQNIIILFFSGCTLLINKHARDLLYNYKFVNISSKNIRHFFISSALSWN